MHDLQLMSFQPFQIGDGHYRGILSLKKLLDFEMTSSYSLTLRASDLSTSNPLMATANVAISVKDVQDQPPVFLNAPFSASLQENTSPVRSFDFTLILFTVAVSK